MGNTRFNLGEVQPGEIQYIRYELRRYSVVITDAVGVVIDRFQVANSKFLFLLSQPNLYEVRSVGVASLPTLSISDAERRAYHNRRVSDALHHHRIFDTMMMSTHPQERCSPSRCSAKSETLPTNENLSPGRSHQGATLQPSHNQHNNRALAPNIRISRYRIPTIDASPTLCIIIVSSTR